jgi:hypothetical protein
MGNTTSAFTPTVLYGVNEKSENKVLSTRFLKTHKLCKYPTYIHNTRGYNFVYGIEMQLSDINTDTFEGKKCVEDFILFMSDTYDIKYEASEVHICIDGDYSLDTNTHAYKFDTCIYSDSDSETESEYEYESDFEPESEPESVSDSEYELEVKLELLLKNTNLEDLDINDNEAEEIVPDITVSTSFGWF